MEVSEKLEEEECQSGFPIYDYEEEIVVDDNSEGLGMHSVEYASDMPSTSSASSHIHNYNENQYFGTRKRPAEVLDDYIDVEGEDDEEIINVDEIQEKPNEHFLGMFEPQDFEEEVVEEEEEEEDFVPQGDGHDASRDGVPYCFLCDKLQSSWPVFDYHVMKYHLKYKMWRCIICQSEEFYCEEEGRMHMIIYHSLAKNTPLLKLFDQEKEEQYVNILRKTMEPVELTAQQQADKVKQLWPELKKRSKKPLTKLKFSLPWATQWALDRNEVATETDPDYFESPYFYSCREQPYPTLSSGEDEGCSSSNVMYEEYVETDSVNYQSTSSGYDSDKVDINTHPLMEEAVSENNEVPSTSNFIE